MGIRSRIILFQSIVVASVLAMAIAVYATIRSTEYHLQRVQWTNHQLAAVTQLTVNANRYSEQIAEFLLIGEPERPDYDSARAELEAGFDRLEKVTRGEAEFLVGTSEQEDDGDEIFRVTRMRALYGEIGKAALGQLIYAIKDGRRKRSASFAVISRTVSTPSSKTSSKLRGVTKRKRLPGRRYRRKRCGDACPG
jgi:hypothetical protein